MPSRLTILVSASIFAAAGYFFQQHYYTTTTSKDDMKLSALLPLVATVTAPFVLGNTADEDALKGLTIAADGIKATFIGHGARVTHLYVRDKNNQDKDIVVGYDDPSEYITEKTRSYFGSIVG